MSCGAFCARDVLPVSIKHSTVPTYIMVNDPVPRAQRAAVAPQAPGAVAAGAQVLGVDGVPVKQFRSQHHRRGWYGDGL